jgi:hypothetical protein
MIPVGLRFHFESSARKRDISSRMAESGRVSSSKPGVSIKQTSRPSRRKGKRVGCCVPVC